MKHVAVLGGGPAGSMAAAELASAGMRVSLFDEKLAWERPCGGGVTFKAYQQYPFLADTPAEKKTIQRTWISAPGTTPAQLDLNRPILIYSRQELNGLLLRRAEAAGAAIEKTRVSELSRHGAGWRIRTRDGNLDADFCVVATGARNPLRDAGTQWTPSDTMIALGYYMPGDQPDITVDFPEGLEGYIWVFPRCGHLSVGICGKGESAQALRKRLESYMAAQGMDPRKGAFYAHMLPALDSGSWKRNRLSGDGWVAVGDAGGLVDPVTGEGIYYALRSGDLAAQAIAAGRPESYRTRVEREFMHDLYLGSLMARRVYVGRFLSGGIPTRMVQFTRHSPRFRSMMQDLFAGTQGYADLSRRLWRNLGATLRETALSYLTCTFQNPKPYSNAPGG
ncbi:MAG: NAD(P)/FAD-dependent oxidoreductase [Acidobacteria bacterium]|nr:NAD(P)/FAD-dependent oxidoreductase [Acidobacteriota bacterium]